MATYNPGTVFTPKSDYGNRVDPKDPSKIEFHPGQDYAAAEGTSIPAASSGTVVYSGYNAAGYGNTTIIKSVGADGKSYYTLYAHQNGQNMLKVGDKINAGDTLGQVGHTGRVAGKTGNHLHFEVINGDAPIRSGSGGPIGIRSSDRTVRTDPSKFNNWGDGGKPYGSASGSPNLPPPNDSGFTSGFIPFAKTIEIGIKNILNKIKQKFGTAETTLSPIVLDLNGDGVTTSSVASGVHFDHDGNGFSEQTGWVDSNDGLLVRDLDGNGIIDTGKELFGSETLLRNGTKAANGFSALAEFDSNSDGKIDLSDPVFNTLKVWKDIDGDGYSSPGELLSLPDAGVKSISLSYTSSKTVDANGNSHQQLGSYTTTSGATRNADDVWFSIDKTNTVVNDLLDIPDEIAAMPDVRGYGKVYDLHQAMVRDSSGHLKDLVTQFTNATTTAARDAVLLPLIYAWAGVENVDPLSRAATQIYGNAIGDARKLATLEAFMGEAYLGTWCWGERDPNPHGPAAKILLESFNQLAGLIHGQLAAQTYLKPIFDSIVYQWNNQTNSLNGDLSQAATLLINGIKQNATTGKEQLSETVRALREMGVLTQMNTDVFRQAFSQPVEVTILIDSAWSGIVATGGNDTLNGSNSADGLRGLGGNDILNGLDGNDTLEGGTGNDSLIGGSGNDTYLFERGFGQDTINDNDATAGNTDVVRFLGTIAPGEISVTRDKDSLYVGINGTDDRIKIENWFAAPTSARIERIEFASASNTVWDATTLEAKVTAKTATELADVLYGGSAAETLNGLGGNDVIVGNAGNDTITGGVGDDVLEGDAGSDTYIFARGWGNDIINNSDATANNGDTILFATGIASTDIIVTRDASNLYLSLKNSTDRITLSNWFTDAAAKVQKVQFSDASNTQWTQADIELKAATATEQNDYLIGGSVADSISGLGGDDIIYGRDGNDNLNGGAGSDSLYGEAGNDTLDGGAGNDVLYGGAGNDTYIFGIGSGQDAIIEYDKTAGKLDTISLAANVTAAKIHVSKEANNLYLEIIGTTDRLTINDWYVDGYHRIEQVKFTDGSNTVWTAATLDTLANTATAYNDYLIGTTAADTMAGLRGDDVMNGDAGNDTMTGGAGNDFLRGGLGNDTYVFNKGDGKDTIYDNDSTAGNLDVIQFGANIAPADIAVWRSGNDLTVNIAGTTDQITIQNWYVSDAYKIEKVSFNGTSTTWDIAAIQAKAVIKGTAGDDRLQGTSDDDILMSGAGNDTVYGGAGNDTLDGGDGNDYLSGGTGADVYLFGKGSGQDTLSNYDDDAVDTNADTILLGAGITSSGITLTRQSDDLLISLNGNTDSLRVQSYFYNEGGSNYVVENFKFADGMIWGVATIKAKVLIGGDGNNTLVGYASADTISGGEGDDILYGYAGNDLLDGGSGSDYLDGGAGNDYLQGGTGNDTLTGDAGNDTLDGGAGNDYLYGGYGADVYLFGKGSGQDAIGNADGDAVGTNADTILLGAGITPTDVTLTRQSNDLLISLKGSNDTLNVQNYFYNDGASGYVLENLKFADGTVWDVNTIKTKVLTPTSGNDTLVGYASADTINGGDGNDFIYGNGGNDSLLGGTGNDTLSGDAGNDTLDGGSGNDVLLGGDGADVYMFGKGSGQDTIYNYDGDAVGTNVDTILLGSGITPADISLRSSRQGYDLLISLNGSNDSLLVWLYFYNDGAPRDVVENLKFADGTVWDVNTIKAQVLTPTSGNDILYGYASADTISGGEGNDTLYGYAGDDLLDGGAGNDYLDGGFDMLDLGGNGNDTYLFGKGSGQDTIMDVDSTIGNIDTLRLVDIIPADVTFSRPVNNSDLVLSINGTTDSITIRNWFIGTVFRIETFQFSNGISITPDNFFFGTTNAETLTGTATNDLIQADAGNDSLTGGAGNDYLNGGAGADSMTGGLGDDTYLIDASGDVVSENAGEGTDIVVSSITYTLGNNLENLTLTGTTAINGTGNTLNNLLTGNSGANLLAGGDGNDTLKGGAGADTLDGGAGIDTVTYNGSTVSVQANLSTGTGTGGDAAGDIYLNIENLTGSNAADSLTGNAGNNVLDGGAGADTLAGSLGDDTYLVDNLADIVTENAGEGLDSINTTVTYTLSANVENLTLLNSGNINGTGNALDNVLTGNIGSNQLIGGAGNDTLIGSKGNDTLTGGTGNDTYQFTRGDGIDTIVENDATVGNTDVLKFTTGTSYDQLWFKQAGNNLEISIIGTTDKTLIKDWYTGTANHVEQISTIDGSHTLLDSKVQNLVNAMAGLTPPAADQTTLPPAYQTQLAPVLAANWA